MKKTSRSRVRAAAIVAVVVGLSACEGADGPTLSRAAFVEKTNTKCATLEAAGNELASAVASDATGPAVASFLESAGDELRKFVRSIDGLVPPDNLQDDVDRLLSLLAMYADGLDELAEQVEPGQSFADVQSSNTDAVERLNTSASRVDALIAKLGLTGCVSV